MTVIGNVCTEIAENAQRGWGRLGCLFPTVWSIGPETTAFAIPFEDSATRIDSEEMIDLHAGLSAELDARFVGTLAEIWTRSGTADEELDSGGLARESETNPEVKTGILVQGFDLFERISGLVLTTLNLDRRGLPFWKIEDAEIRWEGDQTSISRLRGVRDDMKTLIAVDKAMRVGSYGAIDDAFAEVGWQVVRTGTEV